MSKRPSSGGTARIPAYKPQLAKLVKEPPEGAEWLHWVKTKCVLRQEFVIGGFTDPEGSRQRIGALLGGYYDDHGKLVFAGKVGTGFSVEGARDLRQRLDRLEHSTARFTPPPRIARQACPLGEAVARRGNRVLGVDE